MKMTDAISRNRRTSPKRMAISSFSSTDVGSSSRMIGASWVRSSMASTLASSTIWRSENESVSVFERGSILEPILSSCTCACRYRSFRGETQWLGQRVRGSAHPAGQDDGQVVALGVVQQLGPSLGVRHHSQVGDVEQLVCDGVG